MTRSHPIISLVLMVICAVALAAVLHALYFVGVAHAEPAVSASVVHAAVADPVAVTTDAADTAIAVWTKDGPLWAALVVLMVMLRTFVDRQHWIQRGRLLTGLTGAAAVIAALLNWHFNAAPIGGVITAVVGTLALLHHPVVPQQRSYTEPETESARASQSGVTRFGVMSVIAIMGLFTLAWMPTVMSGCAARQRVAAGMGAFLDCEGRHFDQQLTNDALGAFKMLVQNRISGDGHVDASGLKADASPIRSDLMRCAFSAAIAAMATPAPTKAGAPASAPLVADVVELRTAFAAVKAEWGVVAVSTSAGVQ